MVDERSIVYWKRGDKKVYGVLVIDMINDFIKGSLKVERAKRIIPNIKRLVEAAREFRLPVIYAVDSHREGVDMEFELWPPHAIAGTEGAEIIKELQPASEDFIVRKRRYNAFFGTDLDLLLRELKVDDLVLTGVLTDVCVQNTAADAFFRGYRITVLEDCVEALTEEDQKRGLDYMKRIYKAEILNLESFLRKLGEGK